MLNCFKKTDIKTATYKYINDVYNGFYFDVCENGEKYEIYIFHKTIGIKLFIYGLRKNNLTADELNEIIRANMNDYIRGYIDEYMQE